jgi:hypothetical protein
MSFFCLTGGQADGGPLQLSLARALTARYGACSPYPRYFIECLKQNFAGGERVLGGIKILSDCTVDNLANSVGGGI